MSFAATLSGVVALSVTAACSGAFDSYGGVDAGGGDVEEACRPTQNKYKDLADLQKYTTTRSCAFENDACHFDEDPPPLHTVALYWSMIGAPCNVGLPEQSEWDQFCRDGGVLVDPGNPDGSYLLMRLRGDPRTTRVRMPNGSQPLSDEEIYVIEAWIAGIEPGVTSPSDPIDYSSTACPL